MTNCPKVNEGHFGFREVNFDKGTKQVKKSEMLLSRSEILIRECEGVL